MRYFAVSLFPAVSLLLVFTVGGFNISPSGLVCSILVLATFYASTEIVGKFRDGPAFNIYRFAIKNLRELGALIAVLIMYVLVSIPVAFAIWVLATIAPDAFIAEKFNPVFLADSMRLGFAVTLLFGFLYLIGNFPVRLSSLLKLFGWTKFTLST